MTKLNDEKITNKSFVVEIDPHKKDDLSLTQVTHKVYFDIEIKGVPLYR